MLTSEHLHLYSRYKDLEERDLKWGNTPLIVAADVGLDSSVKALLAAGANKDARSTSVSSDYAHDEPS